MHTQKKHSQNTYRPANRRRFCRLCTKCILWVLAFTFTLLAADGPMLKSQPDFWKQYFAGTAARSFSDAPEQAPSLAKAADSQSPAEDSEYPAQPEDTVGNIPQPENDAINPKQEQPADSDQTAKAENNPDDPVQSSDSNPEHSVFSEPGTAGRLLISNTDEQTRYSADSHTDGQIYYSYAESPEQFISDSSLIQSIPEQLPAGQFIDTATDDETAHFLQDSSDWNLILVNPWNEIPDDYEFSLTRLPNGHSIDSRCYPALTDMMNACRNAGLHPLICSSYRTLEKQESLFQERIDELLAQGYSKKDARAKAAVSVARPGTSEHQIGLAVDIVDSSYQALDSRQEYTPVQQWLMENSWKYGFILRYPNDKSTLTGIIYEPWHYRYVGQEAAQEIYERGICLEEYLEEQS